MNQVTPTDRANAYLTGGESERPSFTPETPTRAIAEPSMESGFNFLACVTGRADDFQDLWYNSSSSGGTQKRYWDVTIVLSPAGRRWPGVSVSGGDEMVTFEVEGQDVNAAVTPRGEHYVEKTSRDLLGQMKRCGLCSDRRVRFSVVGRGSSS